MSPKNSLIFASIFFAVMWTAFMVWWNAPGTAGIVIFTICGAIGGVLWYFCMRKVMRVMVARK